MFRSALVIFILLFFGRSFGQVGKHGSPCGGMDIIDVDVHIKGHKVLEIGRVHYSEISVNALREGFIVALADSSYKVKFFLIDYESNNEIKEHHVYGEKATTENAAFIKTIKPGDQLSIECINIHKDGEIILSTSFRIIVTD